MSDHPNTPPICNYEGSDYQASFWDQGNREYEDRVEAIAIRRLIPSSGKRILEIGAGAGRNSMRYTGFDQIVLLDYSLTQIQQAQERLGRSPRFTYVVGDAYNLPFIPGSYDAVTMIRTLHHIVEPPRVIIQVKEALQPEGIFILEFANKQNIKSIVRYFTGRQKWNPFDQKPVEFAELNFDFHPKAICHWLQTAGFSIERQLTVSHFRLDILKRNLPTSWLVSMDSAAQLTGDWWQLSPSVFLRARSKDGTLNTTPGQIFRCPECGHFPLEEGTDALVCTACSNSWPINDGIYILRR